MLEPKTDNEKKLKDLLKKVFESHIVGHKPEKIMVYNNWWSRSVGLCECDSNFYLGFVDLAETTILEIWQCKDKKMFEGVINVVWPTISINWLETYGVSMVLHTPTCCSSKDDEWFSLWEHLQFVVWKEYDKIMRENEECE